MKKAKDEITIRSSVAEYLTHIASVSNQQDSIEMRYEDENIWLTQKMLAVMYDVGINTINYHIKKIFEDSELQEDSVVRKFRITVADGKSYSTNHYSLEMIMAVGFKVNSGRAVQFRKWFNGIVKDYIIQGWVMDDERLKNGSSVLTTEYFECLLEQIREIRLSEREFYQKITDLYATAFDYDRTAKTTKQFFAKVRDKVWRERYGHTESEQDMRSLEHLVSGYLDLAEDYAECHVPVTMEDWAKHLDPLLMRDDGKQLEAELQKGVDSIQAGKVYSADEVDVVLAKEFDI